MSEGTSEHSAEAGSVSEYSAEADSAAEESDSGYSSPRKPKRRRKPKKPEQPKNKQQRKQRPKPAYVKKPPGVRYTTTRHTAKKEVIRGQNEGKNGCRCREVC